MAWKGFELPTRLDSERETETDRFGRFHAQPFERGFGTTVGNALRRVLLSSIDGAAVTAVKIDSVQHEFSAIPGVVEDATDIILNLKQIPLKLHGDGMRMAVVRVDRPGLVTAKDIQADSDVEILEPEAHIATVSEGGKLEMELRIKRGRGYVSADKNFDEDLGIGWIPIDSVHSPVKKVNYVVEAARVGQTTDYDKLTLEVWSNGAVTPRDAVSLAAKLLRSTRTTAGGRFLAGLVRRRAEEAALLEHGDYGRAARGMRSVSNVAADIETYQSDLATLGFYKGGVDGVAGPATQTAVIAFQKSEPALKVDGFVGPATRAALQRAVAKKRAAARS